MKINKNFTLDLEIVEKLRELPNASDYINQLLKENLQISRADTLIEQDEQKKNFTENN